MQLFTRKPVLLHLTEPGTEDIVIKEDYGIYLLHLLVIKNRGYFR